jgi:hypothetical protein
MSVCVDLGGSASIGLCQRDFSLLTAETRSAPVDHPVADDPIGFLKAIPDGRHRRWGALHPAVLAAVGGAGNPEWLPQLP